jgi:hypothetical protein
MVDMTENTYEHGHWWFPKFLANCAADYGNCDWD